jgi:prepilin peptidase CpaA
MPEMNPSLIVFLVGVGVFTLAAAISDFRSRRIPNAMTVPFFVAGLVYQGVANGWSGLADAGLAFLIGFGTLFVLWLVGGGGGGDVKLMGALSAWLGVSLTIRVLIVSILFVIAGTFGVVLLSIGRRGVRRTKDKFVAQTVVSRGKVKGETVVDRQQRRVMAFAIPVALATWSVVLWKLPTL